MILEKIRNRLREGYSDSLKRKRAIMAISAIGIVDIALITFHQAGVLEKLPYLKEENFDANKAKTTEKEYEMILPDVSFSAVVYALNMIFATAGGDEKSGRKDIFDVLLASSVFANAIAAADYLIKAGKQKTTCMYCIGGAILNFAMVPLVVPDIKNRIRKVKVK